jgi:hypothetical protein
MAFHVFVLLLVVCLLLWLARPGRLGWYPLRPSSSREWAKRSRLPVCSSRAAQMIARPVVWPLLPRRLSCLRMSRPWREVKSRRGAPKRIDTQGYACPNPQCRYFGIIEAHLHALVGDGKHGHAERIQTFRCQACRTTFTARRHTPLYRLKTPSHQVAMVLTALAEGLNASAAERVFGYRQATITTWLTRAGEHAQILHERSFRNLHIPHLQLDHCSEPGCARPRKSSSCGWPLIPSPRSSLCLSLVLVHKRQLMCSSIPYDRAWPPFCLPVLATSFESDPQRVVMQKSRPACKKMLFQSAGEKNRQNVPSTACGCKSA